MRSDVSSWNRTTPQHLLVWITLLASAITCGIIPPLRRGTIGALWSFRADILVLAWTAFAAAVITLVATRFASKPEVRSGIVVAVVGLNALSALAMIGTRIQPSSLIAGIVISVSFLFTCLSFSTATIAEEVGLSVRRAASRAVARPSVVVCRIAERFNLREITSVRILRSIGVVMLALMTLVGTTTIAAAIQGLGQVTGLTRGAAAATPGSAAGVKYPRREKPASTKPPLVLHCVGRFGDGPNTIPQDLRDLVHSVGGVAVERYGACPLSQLAVRTADVYEQRAYTNDSDRARVVAWIDNAGHPHATFVTSDQANGYRRIDPTIDWTRLGLPMEAETCGGPAVQPFVDLDNRLVAVGVEQRVDHIGTWEEAVYVPAPILPEWLVRSAQSGAVGVPAAPAKVHGSEIRQWFLSWTGPIDAPNASSQTLDLARLDNLCG
jgi:hypothetical protein